MSGSLIVPSTSIVDDILPRFAGKPSLSSNNFSILIVPFKEFS